MKKYTNKIITSIMAAILAVAVVPAASAATQATESTQATKAAVNNTVAPEQSEEYEAYRAILIDKDAEESTHADSIKFNEETDILSCNFSDVKDGSYTIVIDKVIYHSDTDYEFLPEYVRMDWNCEATDNNSVNLTVEYNFNTGKTDLYTTPYKVDDTSATSTNKAPATSDTAVKTTTPDNGTVQTGDFSMAAIVLVTLAAGAAVVILTRRKATN